MNKIFAPYIGKFVVIYINDILVSSRSAEEHKQHLQLVLQILREQCFYAKLPKCELNCSELEFLGHIVSVHGLRVDPKKIRAVQEWQTPSDVTQGFAAIVAPLVHLTRADVPFEWTQKQEDAFCRIMHALISAPVLKLPDPDLPYEVTPDASIKGIGAVLVQEGHPVAYYSRKFSPAEGNYTTGEQELLAQHDALLQWRCDLEGPEITLVTDHNLLVYLVSQPLLSRKQARWLNFFSRFNYRWVYRPGRLCLPRSNPANTIYKAILQGYVLDEHFLDQNAIRN
eukprot:1160429-Pelagomonas_calceolata.AAC.1